ncbi:MAG: class II aldolase/adducin family protein, partial [Patescibacteria group bacterium]
MIAFEQEYLTMMGAMLGSRPDYVQGGGGNMSAKLPDGGLLIKASGIALKDMTRDHGLVTLDTAPLRAYLAAHTLGAYPSE